MIGKLYKFLEWVVDGLILAFFVTVLYAAFNSEACLKIWDYQYGVCPDFYKDDK